MHPDRNKTFFIETNASVKAIGTIIYQLSDTKKVLIECMSYKLKDYEQNYAVTELECLAVVCAIKYFEVCCWYLFYYQD